MLGSGLKPDRIGLRKVLGACMVVDVDVTSEAHVKAGHGPLPPLLSFISHPVGRTIIVTARCLQYSCHGVGMAHLIAANTTGVLHLCEVVKCCLKIARRNAEW